VQRLKKMIKALKGGGKVEDLDDQVHFRLSSDDVFRETSARYRAVEPEQWLQRHPEAGSSWPSWPQASHSEEEMMTFESREVDLARRLTLVAGRRRTPPRHENGGLLPNFARKILST